MKHIKTFEQSNQSEPTQEKVLIDTEELQEFCDINLAYLLDDSNFKLNFPVASDGEGEGIQIRLDNDNGFKWDNIKDYYIPFLIRLDNKWGDRIATDGYVIGVKRIWVYTSTDNSAPSRVIQLNGDIKNVHTNCRWNKVIFDELVKDSDNLVMKSPKGSERLIDVNLKNLIWFKIHIELI